MQQFIQSLNATPFVQKMRNIEQKRAARISTRHKQYKESVSKAIVALDTSARQSLKETLKEHAEDITDIVEAFESDETE